MSHAEDPSHENDGLGYYDDGIKRTLTDEQVRMFRHSEIQRLHGARPRKGGHWTTKEEDYFRLMASSVNTI